MSETFPGMREHKLYGCGCAVALLCQVMGCATTAGGQLLLAKVLLDICTSFHAIQATLVASAAVLFRCYQAHKL